MGSGAVPAFRTRRRMSKAKTHRSIASLLLGAVCLAAPIVSQAAAPVRLAGSITGVVKDSAGIPQMGAAVLLLNKQERIFQKVFTDDKGEFRFIGLLPDTYSLRVTLAAFVPAFKREIVNKLSIIRDIRCVSSSALPICS